MVKLFKYDFLSILKKHLILYIVVITGAILAKLTSLNDAVFALMLAGGFFRGVFVISLILLFLLSFIIVVVTFYKSVLSDEGYLTHTLPITKYSIVFSKVINAFIFLLINLLILISSVYLVFENFIPIEINTLFIDMLYNTSSLTFKLVTIWILFILLLIAAYYATLYAFFVSLSYGYSKDTKKALKSGICGVVIYAINQVFGLAFILIVFLSGQSFRTSFQIMLLVLIYLLVVYLVGCVLFTIYTNYLLNKKLNLE